MILCGSFSQQFFRLSRAGRNIHAAALSKALAQISGDFLTDRRNRRMLQPDPDRRIRIAPGDDAGTVVCGQEGTGIGEWEQPDSTNPYITGDRVKHNGKTWESLVDNNVWEPGAQGTEALWKVVEE